MAANVVTIHVSSGRLTLDAAAPDQITFDRGHAFYEVVNLDATNGLWVRYDNKLIVAAGEDGSHWVGPGQTKSFRTGATPPVLVSVFRDAGTPQYVVEGFYER